MAVFKRSYKAYAGEVTPLWSRFLVLPKYSFQNLFSSKLLTIFYVICFIPVLVFGAIIYLRHNATFLDIAELRVSDFVAIDGTFFMWFLSIQLSFTFILSAFVGPGLISPDLTNNALPLYLCRPFSRVEYVLGKMAVLILLLSGLTWIPGLLLMFMHAGYSGLEWLPNNFRVILAMIVCSWLWILILALLALALSAWVRWKPVAGALLFVVFFVLSGFGNTINLILETRWGAIIDLMQMFTVVMQYLFVGRELRGAVPVTAACISLLVWCGICLWLLNRRVQAYEVVR